MIDVAKVLGLPIVAVSGRKINGCKRAVAACLWCLMVSSLLLSGIARAADKAMDAVATGDYARAYKLWRPLADKGERNAQFNIGSLYEHGQGVAVDLAKATEWYRKAASRGHDVAQFNLGNMYSDGRGVPRDLTLAMQWLLNAANQGFAPAQFNVAMKYHHVPDVRDYAKAAEWYAKAGEQNHLSATVNLGVLHQSGQGVEKSDARAVELYQKAAEQGHALAQSYLGDMYASGRGVSKDGKAAAEWQKKSAEQGEAEAQIKLAVMYLDGAGVDRDVTEAVRWLRAAGKRGTHEALMMLASRHFKGAGVPQDAVLAHLFAELASRFTPASVAMVPKNYRALIAEGLTPAQIAEARLLADSWTLGTELPTTRKTGQP